MAREQKNKIFWLIKNEEKIVGDHLKLYFYYIKKEQNLVVMYLELIFTEIKTEKLQKYPRLPMLGTWNWSR